MLETLSRNDYTRPEGAPSFHVKLLGIPEIHINHEPARVRGEAARRVLAYLLLASPHVVPNHRLIEAAWEDDEPESATEQIRKIISRLRRDLPNGRNLISTEAGGYRIPSGAVHIDLKTWRDSNERARILMRGGHRHAAMETLSDGLALWRGPALEGLNGHPFAAETVALHEERHAALEAWCGLASKELGASEVIARLRREITRYPLQERLWEMLIRELSSSGRSLEALEECVRLGKALADSLGVSPSPRIRSLQLGLERSVRGAPPMSQPGPHRAVPKESHVPRTKRKAPGAVPPWIVDLLRGQEPNPAYVSDRSWNILHGNQALFRWFPWLAKENANLMRWVLTDPAARSCLHDWEDHAAVFLGMLERALRAMPEDASLRSLKAELTSHPQRPRIGKGEIVEVDSREGHHFTFALPHVTPEPVNVVSHVLRSHGNDGLDVVILTPPRSTLPGGSFG